MQMHDFSLTCPIPISEYPTILLAHGGGGRLMQQLIEKLFYGEFANPQLLTRHDGAMIDLALLSQDMPLGKLAFTTDSYVISPLFFPGGDIGSLSVTGTVNDLAMCGAKPLCLSASFILEEGLPMATLWRVVCSMRQAAAAAKVQIITGDTKVVEKGKGDGLFINTTGIGTIQTGYNIGPQCVQPGDAILVSGDIGRHGMAVMSTREGLEFESALESDMACLTDLVMALIDADIEVHCLRDATRGGLATILNEIALAASLQIDIQEEAIPIHEDVHSLCEILGLDPLYVANEGRFLAFIAKNDASRALKVMHAHPLGSLAKYIGEVRNGKPGLVTIETAMGSRRILDLLTGEQLPRIC